MTEFSADAYVVRYGWPAASRAVSCLIVAAVLVVQYLQEPHHDVGGWFIPPLVVSLVLLGSAVFELRRVASRVVVFAVDQAGIYFGTKGVQELVPWAEICSVELFVESRRTGRLGASYRCVGVRSPGSKQVSRAGNGRTADDLADWAQQYYLDISRPELIPGADGTIRYAYRRMTSWLVNRHKLVAAVYRFAPAVPVINGLNYPPPFLADAAKRARRSGTGGGRDAVAGALWKVRRVPREG